SAHFRKPSGLCAPIVCGCSAVTREPLPAPRSSASSGLQLLEPPRRLKTLLVCSPGGSRSTAEPVRTAHNDQVRNGDLGYRLGIEPPPSSDQFKEAELIQSLRRHGRATIVGRSGRAPWRS